MRRKSAIHHPLVTLLYYPLRMFRRFRQRKERRTSADEDICALQRTDDDSHIPPPLARPRARALTLPLRRLLKSDMVQRTDAQSQSPFFAKLPLEIREQIYGYMFGNGGPIHILKKHKKLGYRLCRAHGTDPPTSCTKAECWGAWYTTGRMMIQNLRNPLWREMGDVADRGLLDPVLTCRRLYSESIPILYSHNIFDFDQRESLYSLSITILPERFNMIRRIQLHHLTNPADLDLPEVWTLWLQIWGIIASMQGLRELRISFAIRGFGRLADMREDGLQEKVMAPLRAVTIPKVFEVQVPWYPSEMENAPFRLRRLEKRGLF